MKYFETDNGTRVEFLALQPGMCGRFRSGHPDFADPPGQWRIMSSPEPCASAPETPDEPNWIVQTEPVDDVARSIVPGSKR